MDTAFNATHNTEGESVKSSSQIDPDLLNINNNTKNVVSSRHITPSTSKNTHNDSNNLIDLSDQFPAFKLHEYVPFQNTPATITNIVRPDESLKDDTFIITNNTGVSKTVTVDQI